MINRTQRAFHLTLLIYRIEYRVSGFALDYSQVLERLNAKPTSPKSKGHVEFPLLKSIVKYIHKSRRSVRLKNQICRCI